MQPNAALMERYGTGLNKNAQSPAARIAASILGIGAMAADSHHAKKLERQAQLMNEAIREHEAMRMQPAISALTRHGIPQGAQQILPEDYDLGNLEAAMSMGLLKGGSAELSSLGISLGKTVAKIASQGFSLGELEKEAIIGGLLGTLKATRAARAAGVEAVKAPGFMSKMFSPGTARLQEAAMGKAPASSFTPPPGTPIGQRIKAQFSPTARLQAAGGEAAPAAAAAAPAAAQAAKAKPWVSTGTKLKLLGGAGLLGAGYMGYKGLQATRDYMMVPSGQSQWGPGYAPRAGVTEYGY